jgi:HSP20 family protein
MSIQNSKGDITMTIIPYTLQRALPGAGLGVWGAVLRTDIRETDDVYMLETEMPGINKEDIELIREDGILTIAVKAKEPENTEGYMRRERVYGDLKRSFALKNIDEETISAKLENGVLFVTLPKQKHNTSRIDIK